MTVLANFSIQRKLLLLLLLSIILVVALVGLSLDLIVHHYHQRKASEEFSHLFREVMAEVNLRTKNLVASMSEIASRDEVVASASMISRYARPETYDPSVFDPEKKALAYEARRQVSAGSVTQLGLYDARGMLIAFYSKPHDRSGFISYNKRGRTISYTRSGNAAWRRAKLPPRISLSANIENGPGVRLVRCCQGLALETILPIQRGRRDGRVEIIGYVHGVEYLRHDFVKTVRARSDAHLALLFDDGKLIGDVKGVNKKMLAGMEKWDKANPEHHTAFEQPDKFLAAVRLQLDDGKSVHVVSSVAKVIVQEQMGPSQELLLLVLAFSVLLIIPSGAVAARRVISEPVDRLLRASEAWSRGDFSRRVPVTTADELGSLARSFNDMAEALKRREEALKESEGRYRTLMDSLPHSAFFKDTDSVYRFCNRRYAADRGMTRDEIIGKTDYDLYPKELAEQYRAADRVLIESGKVLEAEERNFQNGKGHVVHTTKTPVWDTSGRVIGVIGIYWDITERKQAEERARQAAVVFESTAEGVLITDANHVIIAVNKAFTQITGFSSDEAIGATPKILRSKRHKDDFYREMWRSVISTGSWQGEIWTRRKNGEIHPEWMTISVVRDLAGRIVNYVGVFSDISTIKRSEAQLDYLAHHDPLTDLPNRLLFSARLEHAIERARRSHTEVAVLFLDLDRFKYVNDTLGHPVGDTLLKSVATRLRGRLRESDTVARVGGDEFIVTVEDINDHSELAIIAQKLLDCFSEPFVIEDNELHLGASIGISLFPRDGNDVATLVKNADAAMYLAKEQGRNTFRYYTHQLGQAAEQRFHMESALRRALDRNELELFYQPQVDLVTGRFTGTEVLLRWRTEEFGLVPPDVFIPLAEETGLIIPIGEWTLRTACRKFMEWRERGFPLERISVNLSGLQVQRGDLVGTVGAALEETGMPPGALELEITESVIMKQPERAGAVFEGLRALGVELAVDDFGTGYSSLSYLKRFPLDNLKIDKSFLRDISEDANEGAIVRAVIALAENLQLRVTAEGVETEEQRTFLVGAGCSAGQGYLFAKPLCVADFELLAAREALQPLPAKKRATGTRKAASSRSRKSRKGKTA